MKKLLLLFLLSIPVLLFGQDNLTPTNYVNDYCSVLNTEQYDELNSKISDFEKQTDIEISVAIVNTLEERDIESFSNDLFKKWKIGKKDRNNGLLVVIAPNERQWRIEVGYGLEPYLTDYESSVFATNNFKPNFVNDDYYSGINGFLTETMSSLGTKTWEDRVVYKEQIDKENKEKTIAFFRYVLYIVLFILSITFLGFIYFNIKSKIKAKKEFDDLKNQKINYYKEKVKDINLLFKMYNIEHINENQLLIKLIKNSNDDNLYSNYSNAINSLSEYQNRIETIQNLIEKSKNLKNNLTILNEKEKLNNLDITEFNDIVWDNSSEISILFEKLNLIKSKIDEYSSRISKIKEYERLISIGNITSEYINNLIDKNNDKFVNTKYKPDYKKLDDYRVKLIESASQFNMIVKSFDNIQNISNSLDTFNFIKNKMDDYVSNIELDNKKYDKMVNCLYDSTKTIKNYNDELNKYLSKSDVSSSTKSSIRSFIVVLLAFKVTSDILSSFNLFSSLESKYNDLINKAKSDIRSEEERREEERREEERREEERREEERRNTYYGGVGYGGGYGSSYDSDSSFGGFGGGDSGGGGSSGSW